VYDNAGRVSALTGTNYTYGQFINGITYRAWGRPRQITYGNGRTESVTYNTRLKANHYEIPAGGGFGAAVSIDYQYYDDGRLKYSHDLLDNRFDRGYEYDHIGRLTKALSGAEARGEPATSDRPYKETATYDAFDHLNVRSSKHWSKLLAFSSSDTYSNNRRVSWSYDANGNWLSGAGRQHTYDAAGRTSTTTWTNGGYFNEFSDGDGGRVKATEPNVVTYYLRSTVLGGQVVEELNSSGAKQQSFIYIGQKVIGHDWANGNVSLLHEDPSGLTIRSSLPQSSFVTYFAERDPWGAEAFTWDPYLDDPEFSGGRGESGPTYPGFGDIGMPSTGCTLDGVYALCDFISRGMNSGAIALQLTSGGKTKQFPIEPGLLGIYAIWLDDAGKRLNKPQTPVGAQVSEEDVIVTNTDSDGLGHWELISFESQNPGHVNEIERLSGLVDAHYADCTRRLGNSPAPSQDATKAILSTSLLEGTASTLLAVTWAMESGFAFYPNSNPDGGGVGDADIGPMQIDYNTFHAWSGLAGLDVGEVYGTTTTGSQRFNGNPNTNLRAAARILNAEGRGRTAAGRYRVGSGPHSRTARGRRDFQTRAGEYDRLAPGYDAFFDCLRRGGR
jgi:hypothetical protein